MVKVLLVNLKVNSLHVILILGLCFYIELKVCTYHTCYGFSILKTHVSLWLCKQNQTKRKKKKHKDKMRNIDKKKVGEKDLGRDRMKEKDKVRFCICLQAKKKCYKFRKIKTKKDKI